MVMNEFAKTARDGRAITITPDERGMFVTARVAGSVVYTGTVGRVPLTASVPAQYRHSAGPVLLTDDEAAQVASLQAEAAAAWALTPGGLAARREWLAHALSAATEGTADNRIEAFDAGRLDAYFSAGGHDADELAVAAAERELAEFDAEHPEIVAALKAARDADVQRWMGQ